MLLQLYVNDPLGERCNENLSVFTDLKKGCGFELEIIRKTKEEKLKSSSLPLFPAIAIDGETVFEDQAVSRNELEQCIAGKGRR